ncbi:MAG: hypothetical protein R2713_18270 [Ilumatobacteraceae bacterium]
MHLGDRHEAVVGDPHRRLDVRLAAGRPARRRQGGELAGCVPVERTLPLQRLGEVAEERQVRERVELGIAAGVVCHDGMLRRVSQ